MVDKYGKDVSKPQPKHKIHTLRFHLNIGEADKERLLEKAKAFLSGRDQVKIQVQLRGREKSRPQAALQFALDLVESLKDFGTPVNPPKAENLFITLNPKKR